MTALAVSATDGWRVAHRGAVIGLLELSGVAQADISAAFDERKHAVEAGLRQQYNGFERQKLTALPVMSAYVQYYRKFGKTYHVQLQLESIVLKGKRLPSVSPLVDANFAAELETLVLTAGHDVASLRPPLTIDVSREDDEIVQMSGTRKTLHAGDIVMRDASGVSCSIIYGQDNRSAISPATSHVLYVAYGPAGVGPVAVQAQLRAIEENVRLFSPSAVIEQDRLLAA
ncbi:MAG: phenylalanine--tRNA ligase beta subunit-related protein [Burkholderiales bacterium]